MSAQEQRDQLDVLTRHVQQTTKDWPERPARLATALEAAQLAANVGIDVDPALVELEAAWAEAAPPAPEVEPEQPPEAIPTGDEPDGSVIGDG